MFSAANRFCFIMHGYGNVYCRGLDEPPESFGHTDHKLLLEKMTYLGLKTSGIKCFEFYISSRKFYVCVDIIFLEAEI